MQLKQALSSAVARLSPDHVPSPRMNAELLLMFTLSCDRAYLHAHPERELTPDETARYQAALDERARGVPAQYIAGHQEFWGMDLIVSPAVLIPRPETEHVIEAVLDCVDQAHVGRALPSAGSGQALPGNSPHTADRMGQAHTATRFSQPLPTSLRIADVGTGSGCIALALAKELPQAEIHATDISAAALEVARANAARHQLEHRIQFHQADLLAGFKFQDLDFIVSNPPYVGESEADQVQLEVRKFEPPQAVFAGPAGTEVIARLIPQAHVALRPGGWLVMEISGTIADPIRQRLQGWDDVSISSDLRSIPRVARARKPESR